jgi:hypothetical protein
MLAGLKAMCLTVWEGAAMLQLSKTDQLVWSAVSTSNTFCSLPLVVIVSLRLIVHYAGLPLQPVTSPRADQ